MSLHNFMRSLMLSLKEIDENIPKRGNIFDLGCGEGVIAAYLSTRKGRKVIGVDLDRKRLPKSSSKNLVFKAGDIRNYGLTGANAVIISDVLHHIDFTGQNRVLKNIASSLRSGGVLIIKEIDTGEFIRSNLSRFWDFVFYPKDKIYYNNAEILKGKLENLGFKVTIKRPTRLFPGSTTLFLCKKS